MAFSFKINKSSGPDGFGGGFFKNSWNIVGDDICNAVLEFFQTSKLLKQINATTISLIPKVGNPRATSQYRPISCCNIIYKCISKLICSRLSVVLLAIVSPT